VLFFAFSSSRNTNTNTCNFLLHFYYSFTPHSLIFSSLSSVSPFLFHTKLSLTHLVRSHLTLVVYACVCVCVSWNTCYLGLQNDPSKHVTNISNRVKRHEEITKNSYCSTIITEKGRNSVPLLPSNLAHQSAYERSKGRRNFKF